MRRAALLLLLALFLGTFAGAATTSDRMINATEPAFLQDIGPIDPRTDNPIAAFLVAGVVAFIIYRGLQVHERDRLTLSTHRFIIKIEKVEEEARDVVRHVLDMIRR